MVILNCNHMAQLSSMIVLKYKLHRDDEAILLISESDLSAEIHEIFQGLEDKKIFDRVIPYKADVGYWEDDKEKINQEICDYFDDFFKENAVDFADIDKVYMSCDYYGSFGIYTYNRRIKYTMVESLAGQIANTGRNEGLKVRGRIAYEELISETSAYAGDDILTEKYILSLPRPKNDKFSTHKRVLYIDFTKELAELPNEIKERILDIYNVSSRDFEGIDTLVLPNSVGMLEASGLPKEHYPYLYQMALDYYVGNAGTVLVKDHPNGSGNYEGKIPSVDSNLNRNFPMEFFSFHPGARVKNAVAFVSFSLEKMSPYADNVVNLGRGYYRKKLFKTLHRLYVAYSLLESLGNQGAAFHHMHNTRFLQGFLFYAFPQYESKALNSIEPDNLNGRPFTVVVCCPPAKEPGISKTLPLHVDCSKDVTTVFFNGDSGFDFYDIKGQALLDYVVPIKITKTALRDDILADLLDEYIYVISKDAEVREKVRAFSVSKTLYYTGIEIKVSPLDDAEIDSIKMKMRVEDLEIAREQIVDCLTV